MMYSPSVPLGARLAQGPGPRFGPSSTTHAQRAWVGLALLEPGGPLCAARGMHRAASHRAYFPVHICRSPASLRCDGSLAAAAPQRPPATTSATAAARTPDPNRRLIDMSPLLWMVGAAHSILPEEPLRKPAW